jgi:GTP-binding protein
MKITSAKFIQSAVDPSQYPDGLMPEVAFAGRSNVGKSSLINTLINRKRLVRTSAVPGKTRLINFFRINDKLFFVDLPGYGFAKVPVSVRKSWGPMVETYLKERQNLRLVIVILDIRRDPSKDDISLINWLCYYHVNFICVLTKTDKLSKNKVNLRHRRIKESLEGIGDDEAIIFSSRTGNGKETVWEKIMEVMK